MPQYWEYSFKANGGREHRDKPGRRPRQALNNLAVPVSTDGQHPCPRGTFCASSTRGTDDAWHPAMINGAFCLADESAIANALPDLPRSYYLLAARIGDPVRSGRATGRRPPGSRVLVSAEADALLRTAAAVLMGWAARVRAVPGLQLSSNRHLPDKPEGVRDNCGVLARHVTQLLALPPGPAFRTWTFLPSAGTPRPPAVACRRCGLPVSPSPSGKRWWPAVCAHPVSAVTAYTEGKDGRMVPSAWACAACSKRLPRGWQPAPYCDHEPSRGTPPPPRKTPAPSCPRTREDVEEEIGELEVIHAGDGWATCLTELSGVDAGLEVLDLAAKFRRLLGEAPARPEPLEGVPCRECEELTLVEAEPPHDPSAEKDKSRCTACSARMSPAEYAEWTKMYDAWVRGAGPLVCKFCKDGDCGTCWWDSCDCRKAGHAHAA